MSAVCTRRESEREREKGGGGRDEKKSNLGRRDLLLQFWRHLEIGFCRVCLVDGALGCLMDGWMCVGS